MEWFRFYSDTIRDNKLKRVARKTGLTGAHVIGVWAVLLSIASESPQRGVLLLGNDPVTIDDIEDVTDCNVSEVLQEMIKVGMLTFDGSVYSITAWDKRQYTSDNSTPRVQKHRQAAKKREETPTETPTETLHETLQKRFRNAPDTDTDTDTDLSLSRARAREDDLVSLSPAPSAAYTQMDRTPEQRAIARAYLDAIGQTAISPKAQAWLDDMTRGSGKSMMESLIGELRIKIQKGEVIPYNALQWLSDSLKAKSQPPANGKNGKNGSHFIPPSQHAIAAKPPTIAELVAVLGRPPTAEEIARTNASG